MGYVLPKGTSKTQTSYQNGSPRRRRSGAGSSDKSLSVKLPEPVRIPPPAGAERPRQ